LRKIKDLGKVHLGAIKIVRFARDLSSNGDKLTDIIRLLLAVHSIHRYLWLVALVPRLEISGRNRRHRAIPVDLFVRNLTTESKPGDIVGLESAIGAIYVSPY
jgi:hypothetical protein